MANFQKSKYILQNLVVKQKYEENKIIALIATNYTFLKSSWPRELKCVKTFAKFIKCVLKKKWNCANTL